MNFDVLIFDLDNTLVRTTDLVGFRGFANAGNRSNDYILRLQQAIARDPSRAIYSLALLRQIRATYPNMRLAVFTRSPRAYAETILDAEYRGFAWDALVAYEDVNNTKPDPEGIHLISQNLGFGNATRFVLVGDEKVDVVCAYRAGIWVVIDKSSWPRRNVSDNYYVRERLPDALIENPAELLGFLENPSSGLPLLEHCLYRQSSGHVGFGRVEVLNHFDQTDDGRQFVRINLIGRRFRDDNFSAVRRSWHPITHEIESLKEATVFPDHWIQAVREFIGGLECVRSNMEVVVTVIPAKQGRTPRLESFLSQLSASHAQDPICGHRGIRFIPDVFVYGPGAVSHHAAYLSAVDRFVNVRDNLQINSQHAVRRVIYIVIDDVATTGATLFYATHYLLGAGAYDVYPLSMTKAVSAN